MHHSELDGRVCGPRGWSICHCYTAFCWNPSSAALTYECLGREEGVSQCLCPAFVGHVRSDSTSTHYCCAFGFAGEEDRRWVLWQPAPLQLVDKSTVWLRDGWHHKSLLENEAASKRQGGTGVKVLMATEIPLWSVTVAGKWASCVINGSLAKRRISSCRSWAWAPRSPELPQLPTSACPACVQLCSHGVCTSHHHVEDSFPDVWHFVSIS